MHLSEDSITGTRGLISGQHNSGPHAGVIVLRKSRGTEASPQAVVEGDYIATIHAQAHDGTQYLSNISTGSISFLVDGPVATGSVPTGMTFQTGSNPTNKSERLRITSDGLVGIGTSTPNEALEVNGGLALYTTQIRPVCNADSRGTFWFTQDDLNGDSADVCARVAGAYAWRKLF